jgi:type IV pilus assembly protein PilA
MVIMSIQRKAILKYCNFLIGNDLKGFTLIELLVVIIIIGLLAAISLPSFLSQANKSRQSEGKTYIGAIIRAQQVYISEKKRFACNFTDLSVGIKILTENYQYAIDCNVGFGLINVTNQAKPVGATKAYLGGINIVTGTDAVSTLCEALLPPISGGATGNESFYPLGFSTTAPPTCPSGYSTIQ